VTRLRLTALLILAVLAAAGCGEDEPKIPRDEAAELRAALLEAQRRLDPLRCGDLEQESLPKLEDRVAQLPEDSDVRNTLEDGVDHLRTLIEAECTARDEEEQDTTTTTEPETTPPETTEPETTEPETTPPETTPPETTPPEETPPPNPGNGDGDQGNGSGGRGLPDGSVQPRGKRAKKDKD
jgi:hypothetical protein